MSKVDKIIDLFKKNYNISDYSSSINVIEDLFKTNNGKSMVDFNKIEKNKNSPDFGIMSIAVRDYYKLFWEGEATKSLKDYMFPPILNNKTKEQFIMYVKNNKLIMNKCILISLYSHKQKQYKWVGTNVFCDAMPKGASFCNANIVNNVKPGEADAMSLWFRSMVWYDKNVSKMKYTLKTTNLIKFKLTDNKIYGDVDLYVLADYGIKDPSVKEVDKIVKENSKKENNKVQRLKRSTKLDSHKISRSSLQL